MKYPELHSFISFSATDAALVDSLLGQLNALQAHPQFYFVDAQQHDGDDDENLRRLEWPHELVLVVSRAYLHDPFYRLHIRDRVNFLHERRVRLLLTQPLDLSYEPLLSQIPPENREYVPLEELQKKDQLDAYCALLAEDWMETARQWFEGARRETDEFYASRMRKKWKGRRGLFLLLFLILAVLLFAGIILNRLYTPFPFALAG